MLLTRNVEQFSALLFAGSRIKVTHVFKVHNSTRVAHQPPRVRRIRAYDPWPEAEIDLLINAQQSGLRPRAIQELHFPHRTLENVKMKAMVVCPAGIVPWPQGDISKLIACRRQGNTFNIIQAEHFSHRTVAACRTKYNEATKPAALSAPPLRRHVRYHWTIEDDEQLMSLRDQGKTAEEIRTLAYPKCSLSVIDRRVTRLHATRHSGISRLRNAKLWSEDEKSQLRDLHVRSRLPVRDLSVILQRSDTTVRAALESMGLKSHAPKVVTRELWSEEELQQLEQYVDQVSNRHDQYQALARGMNRSIQSIKTKVLRLRKARNQSQDRVTRKWTAEDVRDLDNMYAQGVPWTEIAKKFDCPVRNARARLYSANHRRPERERPERPKDFKRP